MVAIVGSKLTVIPDVVNAPSVRTELVLPKVTGRVELSFSKNGKTVAVTHRSSGDNNWISVWDLGNSKEVSRINWGVRPLVSGNLSADGEQLFILVRDESAVITQTVSPR